MGLSMKKIVITLMCLPALGNIAFAQGSVNWSTSAAAITAQTNTSVFSPLYSGEPYGGTPANGSVGYTAVTGLGFYYQLLYNTSLVLSTNAMPTTRAELATWLDTGLSATNSTAQAGKLVAVEGATQKVVPWVAGVTNNIMVVGWSANLGTSWAEVSNILQNWEDSFPPYPEAFFFGMSHTGWIAPNSSNPGATVIGTGPGPQGMPINSLNMQLYLLPIPEPVTMALIGFGGLSLLLLRRRRSQ
jgi:hypothetical protein